MDDHFVKIKNKNPIPQIQDIDFIYLINLDLRPEKLGTSLRQLEPYGIRPHRVPAVYGWGLPKEVYQEIGVKFLPGMETGADKKIKAVLDPRMKERRVLDETCYGKACFHALFSPGAAGCALSHLSVLQDAYDARYRTIWMLEDDFVVKDDPHLFTEAVAKLDALDPDWDILYTDDLTYLTPFGPGTVWRPDMIEADFEQLFVRETMGEGIFRIGGRCQAHSLLVRRSGMKKILDFEKGRGLFFPYDVELAFAPGMRIYSLASNIVWGGYGITSDTDFKHFF